MNEIIRVFKDGQIRLRWLRLGRDMQVVISGGREHIGAAALAVWPGRNADQAEVSVVPVSGHREAEPVRRTAERLSTALHCTAAVSAGIHFDDLKAHEVEKIVNIIDELVTELINSVI